MPKVSFIESELNRVLFSSISESTNHKTLLEIIELTGKLAEAARQDLVSEHYTESTSAYKNTLNREKLWRENIFSSPEKFNKDRLPVEEQAWLLSPANKDDLTQIVLKIIQKWSEILNYLNEEKFSLHENNAARDTLCCAVVRQCIKLISSALFQARNTEAWNINLEKELLESFNDPQKLQTVMEKISKQLQSPVFNNFFPPEFHGLLDIENVKDFSHNLNYLKRKLFYPLLVDSGYFHSATDITLPTEKRVRNRNVLNTNALPSDVLSELISSKWPDNEGVSLIHMLGSSEGFYHYILSLPINKLQDLINNKQLWEQLKGITARIPGHSSLDMSRDEEVFEYKALTCFLRMLQTHLKLAESLRNVEHKVDDFMNVLDEMHSQEYKFTQKDYAQKGDTRASREAPQKAKFSGYFLSGFIRSYENQREELACFFEKHASFHQNFPKEFEWSHAPEKDSSKAKVLAHAITLYINYLNTRIEQDKAKTYELSKNEKLILTSLSQKPAFQGIGLKPHLKVIAVGQFNKAYPQAPYEPKSHKWSSDRAIMKRPSAPPLQIDIPIATVVPDVISPVRAVPIASPVNFFPANIPAASARFETIAEVIHNENPSRTLRQGAR